MQARILVVGRRSASGKRKEFGAALSQHCDVLTCTEVQEQEGGASRWPWRTSISFDGLRREDASPNHPWNSKRRMWQGREGGRQGAVGRGDTVYIYSGIITS